MLNVLLNGLMPEDKLSGSDGYGGIFLIISHHWPRRDFIFTIRGLDIPNSVMVCFWLRVLRIPILQR